MPYPPRPQLKPLPRFAGTAQPGARSDPTLRAFIVEQYRAGRSLRDIAALTARSHSAVRNHLERAGELRRDVGAPPIDAQD